MPKKALVVGGSGPTGPFIVEGLSRRGYEVTVFHRGNHEVSFSKEVEHLHGDPHFPETIEQTLRGRSFDLAIVTYGRLRYLAKAMEGRTRRLISVGGAGVYRASRVANTDTAPVPLGEDSSLQTDPEFDKFSYNMALSERAVMDGDQRGCYVATHFRYTWVYGPRALAPREWCVMRRLLDGRRQLILPCGGLTLQSRVYAENAAHCVLLAVDNTKAAAGKIYNVSDERVLSLREWAEIIADCLGQKMELIDMPYAWAGPSYPYMGRLPHRVVSNEKIKAELGYRDLIPVEEALRRTVTWLLENEPERGGGTEKALGDPFDYGAESDIIEEYRKVEPKIMSIPVAEFVRRHPYAHPKKPGE